MFPIPLWAASLLFIYSTSDTLSGYFFRSPSFLCSVAWMELDLLHKPKARDCVKECICHEGVLASQCWNCLMQLWCGSAKHLVRLWNCAGCSFWTRTQSVNSYTGNEVCLKVRQWVGLSVNLWEGKNPPLFKWEGFSWVIKLVVNIQQTTCTSWLSLATGSFSL